MGADWRHKMRRAGCACCDDQTFASRRSFLLGGAALGATAAGLIGSSGAEAQTASAAPPRGGDYIIRGGYVVTMENGVEDLLVGDVHVRNGAIAAIGPSINAPGAEIIDASRMIVMPGFVETHSHVWNSLLRNMRRPGVDYVALKNTFGKHHTPTDFYRANRLFMTEALNAGVTTVINYAHNTLTPAHCDEEIRAMAESGLRGRYSFGGTDPTPLDKLTDLDDALRIKKQLFASGPIDGRIDFGFAVRAPGALPKVYKEEFKFAKDNGLPMILHSGWVGVQAHPAKLHAEGVLDKNTIFVHSYMFDAKDHEVMNNTGASNSFSIFSELRDSTGMEYRVQMLDMVRNGVNVCLSFDATSLNPTSTFDQMRLFFNVAAKIPNSVADKITITQTQCLEMATINGAKAMALGDKTGSLKVGKRADIILVRGNDINMVPMVDARSALVHSAQTANVDTVIVDGKVLKFGGKILSVDVEQVKQQAIESMFDLRKRAGDRWTPKPNERPT